MGPRIRACCGFVSDIFPAFTALGDRTHDAAASCLPGDGWVMPKGDMRRPVFQGFFVLWLCVAAGCDRTVPRLQARPARPHAKVSLTAEPWSRASSSAPGIPVTVRCALLATILTAPTSTLAGRSLMELSGGGADDRLVAAATLTNPRGVEGAFFESSDACGQNLLLLSPGMVTAPGNGPIVRVSIRNERDDDVSFRATIEPPSGRPDQAPTAVAGRVTRDRRGEWRVVSPPSVPLQPRALDKSPVTRELPASVPPGVAEAGFEIDTGGDTMGAKTKESGLAVVVRFGTREQRQVIASCSEATRGNALGPTGNVVLDIGACGGLYRLLRKPGRLVVERQAIDGTTKVMASLVLPTNTREIRRIDRRKEP